MVLSNAQKEKRAAIEDARRVLATLGELDPDEVFALRQHLIKRRKDNFGGNRKMPTFLLVKIRRFARENKLSAKALTDQINLQLN